MCGGIPTFIKILLMELTEKCRKVLTFKYALGMHKRQLIQMSGLEKRLNHPKFQQLRERLEKAAVTVVSNDGGILPLEVDLKHTAVLHIGKSSHGKVFYQRF